MKNPFHICFSLVFVVTAACNASHNDSQSSEVESQPEPMDTQVETQQSVCEDHQRLVKDTCTALGPADECTKVEDVCVNLCDGVQTCEHVHTELRVLTAWGIAPDGVCLPCLDKTNVLLKEPTAQCANHQRLVLNACTALGPADACAAWNNVCLPFCEQRSDCKNVGEILWEHRGFTTLQDSACVQCLDP